MNNPPSNRLRLIVVMGVSGSGKSTVGSRLAARLHWPFQEGDDLHPPANIEKMRAGIPLSEADREPWLLRIEAWLDERLHRGECGVVTCSALRRHYRDQLCRGRAGLGFLYLHGSEPVLAQRRKARAGHFMAASLLHNQFQTLEPPSADEPVWSVDVEQAGVDEIVDWAARCLPVPEG